MRKVVTFDSEPPEGSINFSIGQPSADLLPLELIRRASESFFNDALAKELNYGVIDGDPRFLDSLAGFLTSAYGEPAIAEELFATGGNSQGLDMVSFVFASPGDTVFVEEPSFFLAFQIFRDHDLNIVGIPMDENGLRVDAMKRALESHKPAFLYTIPSYQNPSGLCTSEARRRELIQLAEEHDFLIVADEVYQLLNYSDSPPPAYGTMTDSNRVVSLGSFSKILAPGMRVGWIQSSAALKGKLTASGFVNSGGAISHFSSHIVRQAIDNGSLAAHIENIAGIYRNRVAAMDSALSDYFSDIAEWKKPHGGYFFWLRFNESVDTAPLRPQALERETGFMNGAVFSSNDQLKNFLRISFAHYGEDDIREGIARMRPLFD